MVTEWDIAEGIDYNDRPHFVVSCLSLGCEITSRWSHRIDPHRLTCMATKLWDARSLIKLLGLLFHNNSYHFLLFVGDSIESVCDYSDWQLPSYCHLLRNLLVLGALDQLCDSNSEVSPNLAVSLPLRSPLLQNGQQTTRCLWKFALSSAHVGCSFAASCLLVKSVLQRFRAVCLFFLFDLEN